MHSNSANVLPSKKASNESNKRPYSVADILPETNPDLSKLSLRNTPTDKKQSLSDLAEKLKLISEQNLKQEKLYEQHSKDLKKLKEDRIVLEVHIERAKNKSPGSFSEK